jgi:hypothetical protein
VVDAKDKMRSHPSSFWSHLPDMFSRADYRAASRIPKGFRLKAQGCGSRATLGKRAEGNLNPNGVAANDRRNVTQPRWGWKALAGIPRVASPTRQPLGFETESRWDSQRNAIEFVRRTASRRQTQRRSCEFSINVPCAPSPGGEGWGEGGQSSGRDPSFQQHRN